MLWYCRSCEYLPCYLVGDRGSFPGFCITHSIKTSLKDAEAWLQSCVLEGRPVEEWRLPLPPTAMCSGSLLSILPNLQYGHHHLP